MPSLRRTSIALAAAMFLMLGACSSNETKTASSSGGDGAASSAPGKGSTKVGFIFVGPKDDYGYNQAAYDHIRRHRLHLLAAVREVPEVRHGSSLDCGNNCGIFVCTVNRCQTQGILNQNHGAVEPQRTFPNQRVPRPHHLLRGSTNTFSGWMTPSATLPINFNSPYKAGNIIEFWRRWHISLSTFLRDYLYIPLGGNRRGRIRRHLNLLFTMLLGGLWHGANWTFVVWGGLHGVFLVANHGWQALMKRLELSQISNRAPARVLGRLITMLCVIIAWVFFRAEDFETASRILRGMALLGPPLPAPSAQLTFSLVYKGTLVPPDSFSYVLTLFLAGAVLVNAAPNSQTILNRLPLLAASPRYLLIGALGFIILLLAAIGASRGISEFIYFNF